jgi:8-oxo-dGTP pyrophosphatase MutT (NUDIX family)
MDTSEKEAPRIIASQSIFRGRVIEVTVDTVSEGEITYLLEAPAGTLQRGEIPEEGAARELEEELGLVSGRLEKLSEFFVSPGFCEEKMWVYLATELTKTQQRLEDDEVIEVVQIPFAQALSMITTGEIEDAKTIIGVMLAAPRVGPSMLEATYPAV